MASREICIEYRCGAPCSYANLSTSSRSFFAIVGSIAPEAA
jgi:hypothetical protein